jgi:hypothetical protein
VILVTAACIGTSSSCGALTCFSTRGPSSDFDKGVLFALIAVLQNAPVVSKDGVVPHHRGLAAWTGIEQGGGSLTGIVL